MSDRLIPGVVQTIANGVRRLVAPNPGMMTGPGTNTYLLGDNAVAVIDPGPLLEVHINAIVEAAPGPVRWILVTHTHPDHSPAASRLADLTGAALLGRPAPEGKSQDRTFIPNRVLDDGDSVILGDLTLSAVHTPGHASNHLCYFLAEMRWLFTGDHIMNGSTVVIDPPDGNMQHYLDSLAKLRTLNLAALAPGHGEVIDDPLRAVDWLIDHRLQREAKVVTALNEHSSLTLAELTTIVYADVDPRLHRVASRSLLAHLLKLEADKRAMQNDERWQMVSP